MSKTMLNGKPATKFDNVSIVLWGNTPKAQLYKFSDGVEKWVPFSVSNFIRNNDKEKNGIPAGTLIVEQWFVKMLFPDKQETK